MTVERDAEHCMACLAARAARSVIEAPDSVRLSQAWLLGCASGVRSNDDPIMLCDEHAKDFLYILKKLVDALEAAVEKGPAPS